MNTKFTLTGINVLRGGGPKEALAVVYVKVEGKTRGTETFQIKDLSPDSLKRPVKAAVSRAQMFGLTATIDILDTSRD